MKHHIPPTPCWWRASVSAALAAFGAVGISHGPALAAHADQAVASDGHGEQAFPATQSAADEPAPERVGGVVGEDIDWFARAEEPHPACEGVPISFDSFAPHSTCEQIRYWYQLAQDGKGAPPTAEDAREPVRLTVPPHPLLTGSSVPEDVRVPVRLTVPPHPLLTGSSVPEGVRVPVRLTVPPHPLLTGSSVPEDVRVPVRLSVPEDVRVPVRLTVPPHPLLTGSSVPENAMSMRAEPVADEATESASMPEARSLEPAAATERAPSSSEVILAGFDTSHSAPSDSGVGVPGRDTDDPTPTWPTVVPDHDTDESEVGANGEVDDAGEVAVTGEVVMVGEGLSASAAGSQARAIVAPLSPVEAHVMASSGVSNPSNVVWARPVGRDPVGAASPRRSRLPQTGVGLGALGLGVMCITVGGTAVLVGRQRCSAVYRDVAQGRA